VEFEETEVSHHLELLADFGAEVEEDLQQV